MSIPIKASKKYLVLYIGNKNKAETWEWIEGKNIEKVIEENRHGRYLIKIYGISKKDLIFETISLKEGQQKLKYGNHVLNEAKKRKQQKNK